MWTPKRAPIGHARCQHRPSGAGALCKGPGPPVPPSPTHCPTCAMRLIRTTRGDRCQVSVSGSTDEGERHGTHSGRRAAAGQSDAVLHDDLRAGRRRHPASPGAVPVRPRVGNLPRAVSADQDARSTRWTRGGSGISGVAARVHAVAAPGEGVASAQHPGRQGGRADAPVITTSGGRSTRLRTCAPHTGRCCAP